jgi:hypothetical protein
MKKTLEGEVKAPYGHDTQAQVEKKDFSQLLRIEPGV